MAPDGLRMPMPRSVNLFDGFAAAAAAHPLAAAVDEGGACVGFGELHRAALHLAGYMQQRLGLRPGDRVLVRLDGAPAFATACLAAWRCGAAVVPLDPRAGASQAAQARVLLTMGEGLAGALQRLAAGHVAGCIVKGLARGAADAAPQLHDWQGALAAGIEPLPVDIDAHAPALRRS